MLHIAGQRDDVGIVPYDAEVRIPVTSSVTLRVPPSPQGEGFGCVSHLTPYHAPSQKVKASTDAREPLAFAPDDCQRWVQG